MLSRIDWDETKDHNDLAEIVRKAKDKKLKQDIEEQRKKHGNSVGHK